MDNATAILKAVEKYATQDNDVAVFSKILHNEIDEEFALVQQQLKEAVVELVRVQIKGKNPLKTDEFVNNAVADRLNGLLQEEEWVDIIQYMYNHEVRGRTSMTGDKSPLPNHAPGAEGGDDGVDAKLLLIPLFQDSLALMVMIKDICRQKRAEEARRREVSWWIILDACLSCISIMSLPLPILRRLLLPLLCYDMGMLVGHELSRSTPGGIQRTPARYQGQHRNLVLGFHEGRSTCSKSHGLSCPVSNPRTRTRKLATLGLDLAGSYMMAPDLCHCSSCGRHC